MGCDGGTIPRRDELVKVKKKPEAKDKTAELSFQWRCCDITQEILQTPIVTCGMGRLYNKSSVIEGLLNRALLPESAKHIKNLKDVKELNLTPNPEFNPDAEKAEGMIDNRAAPYICPVTRMEMSGKFRFVCLWACGCVMSERAIKEIDTKTCHKCQHPYIANEIIVLNGNESDAEIMKINLAERAALLKAQKKSKKNKSETVTTSSKNEKSAMTTVSTSSASTSTVFKNKRPSDKDIMVDDDIKKIKHDYSVAKDPKVTAVYKSLFTSHSSEQEQNRAHWVTYNPFYN